MARRARARLLRLIADQEARLDRFYEQLLAALLLVLLREDGPDGTIPPSRRDDAVRAARRAVDEAFLARDLGGQARPFQTAGIVIPRSAYAILLWTTLAAVAELALAEQAALAGAAPAAQASVAATRAYLDFYQPPLDRRWADGRTLPERLNALAADYGRRVETTLDRTLAESGATAPALDALRRMTFAGGGARRGRQLARTEAFAAYGRMGLAAARLNPRAAGFRVRLSPTHRHVDACDEYARGGPYALTETEMLPPYHPACQCEIVWLAGRQAVPAGLLAPADPALARLLLHG